MLRLPPRPTLTDPPFPYTSHFRSDPEDRGVPVADVEAALIFPTLVLAVGLEALRPFAVGVEIVVVGVGIGNSDSTLEPPAGKGEIEPRIARSEEHTSELQSLMRNPYAVVCL